MKFAFLNVHENLSTRDSRDDLIDPEHPCFATFIRAMVEKDILLIILHLIPQETWILFVETQRKTNKGFD